MSQYENYDETSGKYDNARYAMAAPTVKQVLEKIGKGLGKSPAELVALEAGCGTGNYSMAMVEMGVGTVHAIDHNEGMLTQLKSKIQASGADSPLAKSLKVGAATDLTDENLKLPFQDGTFHLILVPQVTHHLVKSDLEDPFVHVKNLLKESERLLAPGGSLVIQTQTPEQHRRGFWWADIIPTAAGTLSRRFSPVEDWTAWIKEAGFGSVTFDVPPLPLVRLELYRDETGPTRSEFRGWDSTWSLASPEELEAGLAWYSRLLAAGRGKEYLQEREEIRKKVGQTTTVIAFKGGDAPQAEAAPKEEDGAKPSE